MKKLYASKRQITKQLQKILFIGVSLSVVLWVMPSLGELAKKKPKSPSPPPDIKTNMKNLNPTHFVAFATLFNVNNPNYDSLEIYIPTKPGWKIVSSDSLNDSLTIRYHSDSGRYYLSFKTVPVPPNMGGAGYTCLVGIPRTTDTNYDLEIDIKDSSGSIPRINPTFIKHATVRQTVATSHTNFEKYYFPDNFRRN